MSNLINSLVIFLEKVFSIERKRESPATFSLHYFSPVDGRRYFFFLSYKEHKNLLMGLKHGEETKIQEISVPLYRALVDLREELPAGTLEQIVVIPLPLSRLRVIRRGFNQSLRILESALRYDKKKLFHLEAHNLVKIRETKKQALLSRVEREKSQRGVFKVRKPERLKGRTIILFDDIVTTGSTLTEARKVLLKAGATLVIPVALAH